MLKSSIFTKIMLREFSNEIYKLRKRLSLLFKHKVTFLSNYDSFVTPRVKIENYKHKTFIQLFKMNFLHLEIKRNSDCLVIFEKKDK